MKDDFPAPAQPVTMKRSAPALWLCKGMHPDACLKGISTHCFLKKLSTFSDNLLVSFSALAFHPLLSDTRAMVSIWDFQDCWKWEGKDDKRR